MKSRTLVFGQILVALAASAAEIQTQGAQAGSVPQIQHPELAQPRTPSDLYAAATARLEAMSSLPLSQWRHHAADFAHPEEPSLDDSGWATVTIPENSSGNGAGPESGPGWYRVTIELPPTVGGRDIRGARVSLALRVPSLARVFFNGAMVAQGSGRLLLPILITENAVPGQRVAVAVSTSRISDARLLVRYSGTADPGMLRREILSAEALLDGLATGNAERQKQLENAVRAIDFNALDRGDQQAFTESLEAASRGLQTLREWMQQYKVLAVGNSHIDMAWLWPWTETVEVVRDTDTTALQLMREYPQFSYAQSTAQAFAWIEEKYPDLFRQIRERVKEGRWEVVGGMWVEPDLNMPDGESLVRQLLVGTRYFRHKLDVGVNIGWNPDSFGYNWQLPQIYKKSGFDTFVTQKLSWNDTTVFPYKLFWWQSPDGSRVLTYFPHDYDNPKPRDPNETGIDPVTIAKDVATYVPATNIPEIMHLYGVGDHGGGPTRAMLDDILRLQEPSVAFPHIEFSSPNQFFNDLQARIARGELNPPVWNDELYLEYHRGVFTTEAETKTRIRHDEELLENAEKFASVTFLTDHRYPSRELEESWKKLLFNQFHDIMPGSGIAVVYEDAARDLEDVRLRGNQVLDGALHEIAARADTSGPGVPALIFNPLSWERSGSVVVEAQMPEPAKQVEVHAANGRVIPSQTISTDASTNRITLRVLAPSVPSLGYDTIHIVPVAARRPAGAKLKVSGTTLENEFLRVAIDPRTGCVTSLFNKKNGRETLPAGACGNLLQTFVDRPLRQDAWEIRFDQESWDLKQPQEVKVVDEGPVRATVRVTNKFRESTLIQEISLDEDATRVDVRMHLDWHEQHILLKVAMPVDVDSKVATFEIPYGSIERPTTRNTPAEKAKFEVPALRWADLSDRNQGFSLLNAERYGYDTKDNVIRLSLLRSPSYPNGVCCADQGAHDFTYALYPHAGGWREGQTMQQGYELNFPLIARSAAAHSGSLAARHSFAVIGSPNVILTAVKKAEDDDALIFRFYEFAGRKADVHLQLPEKASSARETNLMEKGADALALTSDGHEVVVPTGPYEIKTVEVFFAPNRQ